MSCTNGKIKINIYKNPRYIYIYITYYIYIYLYNTKIFIYPRVK